MSAYYTVLIPPTRVTDEEANFVNNYRRKYRVTLSETLRRAMKALQDNGKDFKRSDYGSTPQQLPAFLVDEQMATFISELAFEKDVSKSQVVRSAIDTMIRKEVMQPISV